MNVCFSLLDQSIVAGRGEDGVLSDPARTHARLLEDVAAVGGVLRAVEVTVGSPVSVRIDDDYQWCVAALAVSRIGGVLNDGVFSGADTFFDATAVLHWVAGDEVRELDWTAVLKAGRTDPAASVELPADAPYDDHRTTTEVSRALAALPVPVPAGELREVLR